MDPTIGQTFDAQFNMLLSKIQSHQTLAQLSKHLRIRINSWLSKLENIVSNNMWRKNRNNYAKLLYIMLEWKQIIEPFTAIPPEQVPTLQKNFINSVLLKLTTKAKQTLRDKERYESKSQKLTPEEIWARFESKQTLKNTDSSATLKTFICSEPNNSKANKFESINIEYLSPISQNTFHGRCNSNFSECTYSSIQKCPDLITLNVPEHQKQAKQNKSPLRQVDLNVRKARQIQKTESTQKSKQKDSHRGDEVSYFKKNRLSSYLSEEVLEPLSCKEDLKKQQFYTKVFCLLKRHELQLEQDFQYSQVMEELKDFLHPKIQVKSSVSKNSNLHLSEDHQTEGFHSDQNFHRPNKNFYQVQIPQIEESNTYNNNENEVSYDDDYGKFSEIEMDEGISPSRVQHMFQGKYDNTMKMRNQLCSDKHGTVCNFRKGISINKPDGMYRS